MKPAAYEWKLPDHSQLPEEFMALLKEHHISPLLGSIFWNRGLREDEDFISFLSPSLEQLHDPYLLFDMEKAVARIRKAIENEEAILIYGDYDADGITSTTVLYETLESLGASVEYYLPNRFKDGYGPNAKVYKEKIETGISLIITVDNGVSGHEAINVANQFGVDVIVTDHHELPKTLPNAYVIVHPRHPKGSYPFGDLAGVGVSFKLACALLEETPTEFLDLVAIGTVADMVSLTDENRAMVAIGIEYIKQTERMGLSELVKISGIKLVEFDESSIGFGVAPRLNAIGRLEDPTPAVKLLTTFDDKEAQSLSQLMESLNNKRKSLVEEITEEALASLDPNELIHIIVGKNWHEGVLGIVAGKIVSHTGHPAIVMTLKDGGIVKGSGRSVDSVNLYEVLNENRELFVSFGGHHAAVGVSLKEENISELKTKINHYMRDNKIEVKNNLQVDAEISLEDVSLAMIADLKKMAPFGMNNPFPRFLFQNVKITNCRTIGTQKQHLKFTLKNESGNIIEGIGFGFGSDSLEFQSQSTNVVGELSINEWNGNKKLQLQLKDYQIKGFQLFDLRTKNNQSSIRLSEDILFISFSDQTMKKWEKKTKHTIVFCQDVELFKKEQMTNKYQAVLFLDCPTDREEIREIVQFLNSSRVYLVCQSLDEAYLDGMGSREQYGKLFKFIAAQDRIDIRYKLTMVADYLKIPKKLLIFMIQVFFNLGFVTIEDGILTSVKNPENHLLSESDIYQMRKKKIRSEEFLLLSDLPTIKEWLTA